MCVDPIDVLSTSALAEPFVLTEPTYEASLAARRALADKARKATCAKEEVRHRPLLQGRLHRDSRPDNHNLLVSHPYFSLLSSVKPSWVKISLVTL